MHAYFYVDDMYTYIYILLYVYTYIYTTFKAGLISSKHPVLGTVHKASMHKTQHLDGSIPNSGKAVAMEEEKMTCFDETWK